MIPKVTLLVLEESFFITALSEQWWSGIHEIVLKCTYIKYGMVYAMDFEYKDKVSVQIYCLPPKFLWASLHMQVENKNGCSIYFQEVLWCQITQRKQRYSLKFYSDGSCQMCQAWYWRTSPLNSVARDLRTKPTCLDTKGLSLLSLFCFGVCGHGGNRNPAWLSIFSSKFYTDCIFVVIKAIYRVFTNKKKPGSRERYEEKI